MRDLYPLLSVFQENEQLPQDLAWAPKVDIREDKTEFVVFADVPGVNPKDINIEMEGNTLSIKGERKSEKEEKEKNYYKVECVTGKFFRQFILPETVNTTKISAKHKNGVLILRLPKEEQKHSRKITIEATEDKEDG